MGAPPGYWDNNGKRYPVDGDGNVTGSPLSPDEVTKSDAGQLPGQQRPMMGQAYIIPPEQDPAMQGILAQQKLDNHYNYGGYAGGAKDASNMYGGLAAAAQNRQGEQINYGRAQSYGQQAQGNAGAEDRVAALMWKRANGLVPSIAQQQADRQMGQATAAQSSMAASARGPAGLALAQQGAAANTAALQSNISNQAQINSAQERLGAENAAYGAYSNMRGQDFQGQGLEQDAAQKQAALNAAQRAQNDAYSSGLYGNQVAVNTAQLGAQGNQISTAVGAQTAQNQLNQNAKFHSDDQTSKYVGMGLGALGTGLAIGATALFGGGGGGPTGGGGGNGVGGAGGYNGNAPADGSLNPATSGGEYGQGTYGSGSGTDPGGVLPPDQSDVTAKRNISRLDFGLGRDKRDAELKAYAAGMQQATQAQSEGLMGRGPAVGGDPVTAQFAQGLAPSSYDYKPGFGTPGRKVGPMAQAMASNDITGTAVRQDPRTGLLGIDRSDGLKVALGGVGHLAAKQQATDAEVARLRALADSMQQRQQAQYDGQMNRGPAVGGEDSYMLSDERAKQDAMRLGFRQGLNHANTAAETGTFPATPAYMRATEAPMRADSVRRQPKYENSRPAVTASYGRADPEPQRAENRAAEDTYNREMLASSLAVPGGYAATVGTLYGTKEEEARQAARSQSYTPYQPEPQQSVGDQYLSYVRGLQ